MSKLKDCLGKLSEAFSAEEAKSILAASEKFKQQGLSELDADVKAINGFLKSLIDDMNAIRKELNLPLQSYEEADLKAIDSEIDAKYEAELSAAIPDKKEFINNQINDLVENFDYDKFLLESGFYESYFDQQYEKKFNQKQYENEPRLADSEAEQRLAEQSLARKDNPILGSSITALKNEARDKSEVGLIEADKRATELIDKATDVVNIPISSISTDEKRFQNREELDKDLVKNIAENFDENQLDPIVVWREGGKTFVLAGHHRLEGSKQAGKTNIKARYFNGNENQAIEFAREKSNANRTMENPTERAKIYRDKLARGENKKDVEAQAKLNEGKNANFYLNIAALNPEGKTIQTYNAFKQSEDKSTQKEVDKIMDWIGEIRRSYPELTNQHEEELFNFLFNGDSKRITTKSEFKQKVNSIVGAIDFNPNEPLNIARFKYKSEGEQLYDKETNELKTKISDIQNEITQIKDRFINPKNIQYIKTTDADYESVKSLADEKIAKLNAEQKKLQSDLLELQQKKGQYITAGSNQESLFQKESSTSNENIQKVIDVIQKAFPKVKVEYDENLKSAGQLQGNTIKINPYYAGNDTPIHEAAHILLDAMGENKVVEQAVKQLKETELWNEIKERYPELNEKQLANEVLAEAIGREGEGIFKTEAEKSRFKAYLSYLFDWFKTKLGLNKNVAQTLAKQIIGGYGTKDLTGKEGETKLQKPKTSKTFNAFRRENLSRDLDDIKKDLKTVNDILEEDDLDEEERASYEGIRDAIESQEEADRDAYERYLMGAKRVEDIIDAETLEGYTLEELVQAYEDTRENRGKAFNDARAKIAIYLSETRKKDLRKHDKFIEENANKKDLTWKDRWFKTLSHMTENFPELQGLNNLFEDAYMDMQQERNTEKKKLKKLADAVIKDKNKKLGITGVLSSTFSSDNAKYFEYMDKDGKYITDTSGLSQAQIDLLNYIKDLTKNRVAFDDDGNVAEDGNDVLKLDRGFVDVYKDEGLFEAMGHYLGGQHDDVEISYTNPNTGNTEKVPYSEAEKEIIAYSKKGLTNKAAAVPKLLSIAYKAKKNAVSSNYSLGNGQLVSKFSKARNKDKGYSKDFYNAAVQYIDDYTHVKHLSKLVPIVDSIEYLAERGYGKQLAKPNVKAWLKDWKEEQLYKKPKETDPLIDTSLKLLRTLTSQIVMGFNIPASVMNVFIGNYNNWRADAAQLGWGGLRTGAVANKRFFSKKGQAILKAYDVVKLDETSLPVFKIGKAFQDLAYAAQSYGERQIQGTMFLSQLTDTEWNNIEVNKDGELTIKGDKKELKRKFSQYKNKVTDIQGKYSEKDRRNFMRGELGKIASQFKVWMPDAWKVRFGSEYINANNEKVRGTWRILMDSSISELRKQALTKEFWKSPEMVANLKGAALVATIWIAMYSDDEDKDKKRKALSLENALGNLLFVFDPEQLKYMAKNPVAATGTVTKFIDVFQDMADADAEKLEKDIPKIIPYGKAYTQAKDLIEEE